MAMKKCKECGEEISSSAKVCPKCGKKQKVSGCLSAILVIIILIIIISVVSGGNNKNITNTIDTSSPKTSTDETSKITLGQKNALRKAKDYLAISGFSYEGLRKQLEFEGFTTDDTTYALDNCEADWNEQAARKAKEYLNVSSFSKSSLMQQLEFEGFTSEQAEYGASAVGY